MPFTLPCQLTLTSLPPFLQTSTSTSFSTHTYMPFWICAAPFPSSLHFFTLPPHTYFHLIAMELDLHAADTASLSPWAGRTWRLSSRQPLQPSRGSQVLRRYASTWRKFDGRRKEASATSGVAKGTIDKPARDKKHCILQTCGRSRLRNKAGTLFRQASAMPRVPAGRKEEGS